MTTHIRLGDCPSPIDTADLDRVVAVWVAMWARRGPSHKFDECVVVALNDYHLRMLHGTVSEAHRSALEDALERCHWRDSVALRLARCAEARVGVTADSPALYQSSHRPHVVIPGLWVGGYYTASEEAELDRMGVTHVCSCIDTTPLFPLRFQYVTLPMDDTPTFDPTSTFRDAAKFVMEAYSAGGTVFVHCGAGISRAPTVVAAVLMAIFRLSASQAIDYVRRVRPCAYPNKGFVQRLVAYGALLLR